MPERSALVMPCDESGSNMEAASPTASQAGPAAGSRTRDSGSAREQRAQGGGGADERGDVHGGDELGRPPGEIVEAAATGDVRVGQAGDDALVPGEAGGVPPAALAGLDEGARVAGRVGEEARES